MPLFSGGALGEPGLHAFKPVFVAEPQILMAHPLAPGQQGIGELNRLQRGITRQVLEPFGRVACRTLQFDHFQPALILVNFERRLKLAFFGDQIGQANGVLERQLGARANRKMRRVRGIAHQHDIVERPMGAGDGRKFTPRFVARMRRIV